MRRIGRARLCDLPGCPHRWPCPTHGTRRVGDYEHLGVHAGAFELVPFAGVIEVAACETCGYGLCACKRCESCGGAVEVTRGCYVHPTCYNCLPPPAPIPTFASVDQARRYITQGPRPGWTTDGESYFNDAIGFAVCVDRGYSLHWRAYPNSERWNGRGVWIASPFKTANDAMRHAEEVARIEAMRAAEALLA